MRERQAGEYWLASIAAGDVLHDAMNEINLGSHRLGDRERVQVVAPHGMVDAVQQERQPLPVGQHLARRGSLIRVEWCDVGIDEIIDSAGLKHQPTGGSGRQ